MAYPRINSLKTAQDLMAHLDALALELPFDAELESGSGSPLASALQAGNQKIGNRFCILPMEGWDGTQDGQPTDLTQRRWRNFGRSGAKLIWGGEAIAVRHDGRANPNQLLINDNTLAGIESLLSGLRKSHQDDFGNTDDLMVGLQLTHSGRFARPNEKTRLEPSIAYHHPILDSKCGISADHPLLSDDQLDRLVDDFVIAASMAARIGFEFVDIKHCHGYLGHELLSGYDRPGKYGGSFENRTRFLRSVVAGIRSEAPALQLGSRVSIFDFVPFNPGDDGIGVPSDTVQYALAFGGDGTGTGIDLTEPKRLMRLFHELGVTLVCTTAGSPYYNPHIQRPAIFPPSDGYQPPEDPLVGVVRQIHATAQIKAEAPELLLVGSGYTYLQDWLPHVAQAVVRNRWADSIGLGRMVLSYPELPADVIAGKPLARKKICRTFSECTTGPRNGMISGCFPLDPFYKAMPERQQIVDLKKSPTRRAPQ